MTIGLVSRPRGENTPDVRVRFGEAVRLRRQELGLTQEGLADGSGLRQSYVAQVESGKRNISLLNIEKLARALKVPTSALFSRYGADAPED